MRRILYALEDLWSALWGEPVHKLRARRWRRTVARGGPPLFVDEPTNPRTE